MDEFEFLKNSGEWWTQPWWERIDRQVYCPYPKEEIARSADFLKRYFDATWTRELATNPCPNIVFPNLCIGGSTSALGFIVYLGRMLRTLEASDGIDRIVTDLKENKSESALLELEAAYAFADAGYQIQFPYEGGTKSPDVMVTSGDTCMAIECKRLQSEAWEDWEHDLTSRLIGALPWTKGDRQISVQVTLNRRLTQVCVSGDKEPALNKAFADAIVHNIVTTITNEIGRNDIPIERDISELASVRIAYRDDGEFGSVLGMERASPPITRRILQNGVIRACEQIPYETPGVVVVYSKVLPESHFFKVFFDAACKAQPERFSRVVAVALCPMQTIFRSVAPTVFPNKHTRFQDSREMALEVLTSQFGGLLVGDY